MVSFYSLLAIIMSLTSTAGGFGLLLQQQKTISSSSSCRNKMSCWSKPKAKLTTSLFMSTENSKSMEAKAAPVISGEELEVMLTEWDMPLVLDAYATWCGPCMIMAPEFEAAAKELKGRVRFVKLDTDAEPDMSSRLNIMGLPTLMFLNKYEGEDEVAGAARATLLQRIEGAIMKDAIVALCEHLFFDGPKPEKLY